MESRFATVRGIFGALMLVTLAACNFDGSSSDSAVTPPTGEQPTFPSVPSNPQVPVDPTTPEEPTTPQDPTTPEPPVNPGPDGVAPQISGSPVSSIKVGQAFNFQPQASDADGDVLAFSITGKPDWASFDDTTGHLWGTAQADDIGATNPIVIGVSDGLHSRKLPQFKLNVRAASQEVRNYHPGHYIALMRKFGEQSIMQDSMSPGVVGFVKRYTWKQLEPTQGNYDFSMVQSDLDWATAYGMRLIVQIEDKTFFKAERSIPNYLSQYELPNRKEGYTAVRWNPVVFEREKALIVALSERISTHPALEGVVPIEETSPGFDESVLDQTNYSPETYRDMLIELLTLTSERFPTSRIFWFMNFFPRNQQYIGAVAAAVADKGVVMGGPDVLPEDKSLTKNTYPFYREFASEMPLFGYISPPSYGEVHSGSTKVWTPAEMLDYSVNELKVSYIFWMRFPKPKSGNSYGWTDALPVIRSTPVGLEQ